MKICGLWVDIQEVQGPFWKVVEMKELTDLIYNGKFHGPSPRCGGPAARSGPRWTMAAVPCRRAEHGREGSSELTGGMQQGEGGHGELDGLLTGAQAAARWPGDGGERRRRSMCW
jgi:hypothetical protein